MAKNTSIAVYFTGKLVSQFPTHVQSCNRKTIHTGEMLALENKYRKKHTRTVANYNEH